MTGYIYKITNTKNQKVYIGQTIQKPCVRFAAHVKELNANKKKNGKFQNAWNKYGKVFKTSMEAAESIGTNDSNIIRACKKKGMRCGVGANGEPLLWSWDDEYNGYSVMDVYKGRKGGNNRKAVRNIETGIVYQSATAAAEHHNCDKSTILRACHGRLKSADNYHWEFV